MPEAFVDGTKVIEVNEEQRQLAAFLAAGCQLVTQCLFESRAIPIFCNDS